MANDASSASSFSSLDNVSRSNMLRRQREAALRRRQIQVPIRDDSFGTAGGRSVSHQRSSMTTSAMADVLAWEEAKTKQRIEARIKEEELQRVEEARNRAEIAKAAEAARIAELERFQLEQRASEQAAQRLEEEARRLAEAKADVERLEKERLANEMAKRVELERLQKELQRERLEKEKLAAAARKNLEAESINAQARIREQKSLDHRSNVPLQGGDINDTTFHKAAHPSNHGYRDSNGMAEQQLPPPQMNHETGLTMPGNYSQPMAVCNVETDGRNSPDMAGSSDGYKRYLSSFHQPDREQKEDSTLISELSDGSIPSSTPVLRAETNEAVPPSKLTELRASRIKRSISTRSLSFTEESQDAEKKQASNTHPSSHTPKEDHSNHIPTKTSSLQQISIENLDFDDPTALRSFLMKPFPKGKGVIQCSIKRNKGIKNALFPEYRIYLKSNNSKTETFLMTSKKRVGNKTSNYLISMSRNDHEKNSDSILGKLRSNFLGTEYMIYDHGKNPDYDDSYYDEKNKQGTRCELGAILYGTGTSLGSKGPRKMKVCINNVDDGGNPLKVWRPNTDDERMVTCFKNESSDIDKLVCLQNKPPSWNDGVGAYVLNFNGRVTMASVKNFQLCGQNDELDQTMQFGRTGKDEFSLDVQWPMSLFQAFAVSLSSFDSKLGCD